MNAIISSSKVAHTLDHVNLLVDAITRDVLSESLSTLPLGARLDDQQVRKAITAHISVTTEWIAERTPRVTKPQGVFVKVWDALSALAGVEFSGKAATTRLSLEKIGDPGSNAGIITEGGLVYATRSVVEENFFTADAATSGIERVSNVSTDLVFGSQEVMSATADWKEDHCVVRSAGSLTERQALLVAALSLQSPITPPMGHPDCFVQTVVA